MALTDDARRQECWCSVIRAEGAPQKALCVPCKDRALTAAQEEIATLRSERDEYHDALVGHLCKHDMADWVLCGKDSHGPDNCEVCAENDKGLHRHALQVRAEKAEEENARLRKRLEAGGLSLSIAKDPLAISGLLDDSLRELEMYHTLVAQIRGLRPEWLDVLLLDLPEAVRAALIAEPAKEPRP